MHLCIYTNIFTVILDGLAAAYTLFKSWSLTSAVIRRNLIFLVTSPKIFVLICFSYIIYLHFFPPFILCCTASTWSRVLYSTADKMMNFFISVNYQVCNIYGRVVYMMNFPSFSSITTCGMYHTRAACLPKLCRVCI